MAHHRQCYACHVIDADVPQQNETKSDKPVKAKDVLDIRIVPGNTNAWIECYENTYDVDAKVGNADQNAQIESVRLKHHLVKKEEKLKSFQEEVKRRVAHLQKLKRQEEQRKSLKMVEDEHNLVLQRTLGIRIPYHGNAEDLQSLNKELLKSCIIPCNNDKQLLQNEVEKSDLKVEEIAEEIKAENLNARSKLLLKKLETYETSLPGGNWSSPSQKLKQVSDDSESSVTDDNKLPISAPIPDDDTWFGKDTNSSNVVTVSKEEAIQQEDLEQDGEMQDLQRILGYSEPVSPQNKLNYVFDYGKYVQVEKVQKQNQFWKYRKIFMEIERDQVKENKKRKDHRKRVQHLKLVKEQERKLAEKKITQFPEKPIEDKNKENSCSVPLKADKSKGSKGKLQEKEMYRYMEALRKVAKERVKFCNVSIPPLCSCGPSFWDSHPDKCANNCIFYKNMNVYVAALTSALANTR